jgi:hypothetical protein
MFVLYIILAAIALQAIIVFVDINTPRENEYRVGWHIRSGSDSRVPLRWSRRDWRRAHRSHRSRRGVGRAVDRVRKAWASFTQPASLITK